MQKFYIFFNRFQEYFDEIPDKQTITMEWLFAIFIIWSLEGIETDSRMEYVRTISEIVKK